MTEERGSSDRRIDPEFAIQRTPNAERYVLEADAMRRRQLRSALLHGTGRNWREHRRAWPGVVAGLIVVAVILAVLSVVEALETTQQNQRRQDQEQREQTELPAPKSPGSSSTPR